MAQRDPLVEYQREGFQLFQAMMESIKEESVGYLFNVEVQVASGEEEQEATRYQTAASLMAGAAAAESPPESDAAVPAAAEEHAHRPAIVAKGLAEPEAPRKLAYSAPTVDGDAGPQVQAEEEQDMFAGVSRNELCPCGSGRKFKRCHGDPARRNA
jgi:preprotein translocase subunit SecA